MNLTTETGPITIITRYVITSGKSTLWVNATSESDPNVAGTETNNPRRWATWACSRGAATATSTLMT